MNDLLEWGILSASLCNAILILWLGVTVLLNARRRGWGTYLAVLSLGTGALFFIFHSAIISHGLDEVSPGIIARWPIVWLAGVGQPFAWYLVMLWHNGFWEQRRAVPHYHWHKAFLLGLGVTAGTICVLALCFPLSPVEAYPPAALLSGPMIGKSPVLAIIFSLMMFGCCGMALDIVIFPGPSSNAMGDLAQRRARPWLIAASLAMLSISLLLAIALLNITPGFLDQPPGRAPAGVLQALVWTDLFFSLLVTADVLLLGQAVVSYEIFTGTTLPRRGLRQQWRNIILMTLFFSTLLALALVWGLPPIFSMLVTVVLLAIFSAITSWRTYREQERFMGRLRHFMAGPCMTEALKPESATELSAAIPFRALCEDILGTRWACLTSTGPFAALVTPLSYPGGQVPAIPANLLARCTDPDTVCLQVEMGVCGEAAWSVPLWSPRGLIGLLLLGEKCDGGLYAQEEMELARAAGERIIDELAGGQMARRLMEVQRSRLSEDQLADRRTRRVIHDEILPRIHTLTLSLNAEMSSHTEQLAGIHHSLAALLRDMPATAVLDIEHHGVIGALKAHCENTYTTEFSAIEWDIDPVANERVKTLAPLVAEVLYGAACEAIRNAARYGRAADNDRPLILNICLTDSIPLTLAISDNGVGLANKLPSVGSGQGVLLHSTMMAVIGGAWNSFPAIGTGTSIVLTLPE